MIGLLLLWLCYVACACLSWPVIFKRFRAEFPATHKSNPEGTGVIATIFAVVSPIALHDYDVSTTPTMGRPELACAPKDRRTRMTLIRSWPIHNLFAHPISELLHWIGLGELGNRLHDATLPEHTPGTGRG